MKVTELTVGATRANGNYGNNKVELRIQLEEGEKAAEVYQKARRLAETLLEVQFDRVEAMRAERERLSGFIGEFDELMEVF